MSYACFEDLGSVLAVLDDLRSLLDAATPSSTTPNESLALLQQNWPAVEALAKALCITHNIESDQIEKIISEGLTSQ